LMLSFREPTLGEHRRWSQRSHKTGDKVRRCGIKRIVKG
jgi:hypothetical protein